MDDCMDFDGNGTVDPAEEFWGEEMLCGSSEEHRALFGDDGDFGGIEWEDHDDFDEDSEEDSDFELESAGLFREDLEFMDEDERREVLEEAGLDPEEFEF